MMKKHQISLPKGICKSISKQQLNMMIDVALSLTPLWENAIGKDWPFQITRKKLEKLYLKM